MQVELAWWLHSVTDIEKSDSPARGYHPRTRMTTEGVNMADGKTPNPRRLICLFIAFLGCIVVALPILYDMASPAPLILIGSGVTVVALALFLFFSS